MSGPSDALVSTGWLADHLEDDDLRIYDCTVILKPSEPGTFAMESGRADYDKGHIPGAGFLDLTDALSDPESKLRFTMPKPERFAAAMGSAGVGDDSRVVLYCAGPPMWATRVWWMLRAIGFSNASVLDGGLTKWQQEERPLSTERARYRAARLAAIPHPELFASKTDVEAAIQDGATCVMNALTPEMHRGEVSITPRAGRIAGSMNLPAMQLTHPDDHTFLEPAELRKQLEGVGTPSGTRVITYCGGGIAATQNAFALYLTGARNVAVYDGSLSEWAADPDAPMETG